MVFRFRYTTYDAYQLIRLDVNLEPASVHSTTLLSLVLEHTRPAPISIRCFDSQQVVDSVRYPSTYLLSAGTDNVRPT